MAWTKKKLCKARVPRFWYHKVPKPTCGRPARPNEDYCSIHVNKEKRKFETINSLDTAEN